MTDFASLAIQIDASQADKAATELDNLAQAGARAEKSANTLHPAMQRVGKSAGEQRAGMQQLSFQIGDVAQQFALGTNPMIIFAQQGQQVVQALSMMKGGATGLVGFLAGPWGAVIMGAAMIVGTFASKLLDSGDAADTAAKKYANAAAEARGLIGAMNAMALNEKRMNLNKIVEDRMRLENKIGGASGNTANDRFNSGNNLINRLGRSGDEKRLQELRWQEVEARNLISLAERGNAEAEAAARRSTVTGTSSRGTSSARTVRDHTEALTDQQKAYNAASKSAEDYITRLEDETAKIGKTSAEIRMMEVYSRAQAAATDEQRLAIIKLGQAREDAYTAEAALKQTQQDGENAVKALDIALKKMDDEKQRRAENYNDTLRDTINLFDDLGGAGKTIGTVLAGIYGLRTGDFSGVGGAGGAALSGLFTSVDGDGKRVVNELGRTFGKELDKVFGGDGKFFKALQNGGTGMAIGGMVLGQSGSNFGSFVGGAFGEAAFKSLAPSLFKKLGDFAGPIGTIVGGLLGGLIGKIFGKTKWGSVSVGQNGASSALGNKSEFSAGASKVGGGIASTIESIAQQLGGTVGNYAVSIGLTNGNWNVNPGTVNGKIGTKWQKDTVDFKKDEEGAIRWAIANAIQDGAIQGIKAGAQALISKGGDIEKQLAKALKFQSVFDELKSATDPAAYALEKITREFDNLRSIFDEAGASAADYADLEKLLQIRRQEAVEQSQQDILDKLRDPLALQVRALELLGNSEEALAATRLVEIAGLKSTLQPLQSMIYQLEDARSIIDKFGPLSEDLKKFRTELLGGESASGYGVVAALFRSTASAAAGGDATAMGELRGAATNFLDAAKENASSALDYNRALGEVLASVDKGIFAADAQIDYAQVQIDAIRQNSTILADMAANLAQLQQQILITDQATLRLWQRLEGEGLTVITTQDEPLQVEVVS